MSNFTDAIQFNWPTYVISPGSSKECHECASGMDQDFLTDEMLQCLDEGSFSYSECDSCGSTFGGDRFNAHAINREAFGPNAKKPNDIYHIDICADCLMFHANGDEPEDWEQSPTAECVSDCSDPNCHYLH